MPPKIAIKFVCRTRLASTHYLGESNVFGSTVGNMQALFARQPPSGSATGSVSRYSRPRRSPLARRDRSAPGIAVLIKISSRGSISCRGG